MGQLFSAKPVLFHEIHGHGIEISENKSTAKCVRTTDCNLLFSSHPIKTNQRIHIKLLTVSDKTHDIISVGFTSHDPSTFHRDLPKCDDYELEAKSGFWVCTLSKYYCIENSTLCFYLNESGNIQYGISDKANRKTNVTIDRSKPLWAVIHIWSAPTAIALLDPAIRAPYADAKPTPNHFKTSVRSDRTTVRKDASVETLRQAEENSTCAICYENSSEAALFPCGHLCMCYECARMQWRGGGDGNCPMCRVPIQTVLKIYKS
ncbi:neuralized-like [Asbolus verrucosus]|uniref:Neuralized-like n=1 Tax=Asbolus verrucosus TaxID=1661398 RepID=A0A482VS92_ASBVE|nr:neuralized-like [Asbolus verrucosus]